MSTEHTVRLDAVRQHLNQEYGMEGADLEDLIVTLKSNLQELNDGILASLKAGQWPDLSRHGHSLKGVAANIEGDEIADGRNERQPTR